MQFLYVCAMAHYIYIVCAQSPNFSKLCAYGEQVVLRNHAFMNLMLGKQTANSKLSAISTEVEGCDHVGH